MELENNNNEPKNYFIHGEEEYVNRKPVFKSYKIFYPSEMDGVLTENEFSDIIRRLNIVMNRNPICFFRYQQDISIKIIMTSIVGPIIIIFISFVVYKEITKKINKSLEKKRSIKFSFLGDFAVEIQYFQQSQQAPNDGYSETSSLLNKNVILV
ncbi:hypothetical protein RB653_000425 [Dictyostelium firmibasis]|uniref:Uncharacterized protein n=1 Tax=Dictyostelium firmibasis TaxID=79012 RepID=A0AAN7U5Y0_9MYCE